MRASAKILISLVTLLFACVLIVAIASCNGKKKAIVPVVIEKHTHTETFRDTIIHVPAEQASIALDSANFNAIVMQLQRSASVGKHDTISISSANNGAQLKLYLDLLGRLQFDCDKTASQYQAIIKLIEKNNTTITQEPIEITVKDKGINWWKWCFMATASVCVFLFLKRFWKLTL